VLPFFKLQGLGNDYVYLDAVTRPAIEHSFDLPTLSRVLSDRHRGIGSDGLIVVAHPTAEGKAANAHARMRIFNADGSEAQMCGNGVRCVAKLLHDHLKLTANPLRVQTGAGVLTIDYRVSAGVLIEATVDMGPPTLEMPRIPVSSSGLSFTDHPHESHLHLPGAIVTATFVSMGNPHAVIFMSAADRETPTHRRTGIRDGAQQPLSPELASAAMHKLGPQIERHPAFPQRTNAHFVVIDAPNHATMFTWERGSGATRACGTGACAVLVAGVLTGRLARTARLTLPGGELKIRWPARTGRVLMTGPAELSFVGTLDGAVLATSRVVPVRVMPASAKPLRPAAPRTSKTKRTPRSAKPTRSRA